MASAQTGTRPSVSVVVPFGGEGADARALVAALARLRLCPDDELIVVDNGIEPTDWEAERAAVGGTNRLVAIRADAERSSYYARNVGAEAAANEWILFLDSDCIPSESLIDDYFGDAVGERVGVVAGRVTAAADQPGLVAAYARSRGHISEEFHLRTGPFPAGVTANLLVRRAAWDVTGGFFEGVRSGADIDFCWRLQSAEWEFEHRPGAEVAHSHPVRLRPMLRKTMRHAAGRFWVDRRWQQPFGRPRILRPLIRSAGGALVWTVRGQFERALFKLLDGAWAGANVAGYLLGDNRAKRQGAAFQAAAERRVLLLTDAFPARSETFINGEAAALEDLGWRVRVESSGRPLRIERSFARRFAPAYLEDDRLTEKLASVVWLVSRHPLRCLWDVGQRRRWRAEEHPWRLASIAPLARRLARGGERHIHVHFAAGAALHALRVSRLVGVTYSVMAHAYDIFKQPRNLAEKLEHAEFALSGTEYNVSHLRRLVDSDRVSIHRITEGMEVDTFRRRTPYPEQGAIAAIGRLVEKKGFQDLVEAAALMRGDGRAPDVVICGGGPLRAELVRRIEHLGLGDSVELVEAWGPGAVTPILERAAVLAMPCVIAADGDRDGVPTVVKEALAMEVPVVGTTVSGLPEFVSPDWGRLVPPSDPAALAAALREVIELPREERERMGKRGRAFVARECDMKTVTERLSSLLERAVANPVQNIGVR